MTALDPTHDPPNSRSVNRHTQLMLRGQSAILHPSSVEKAVGDRQVRSCYNEPQPVASRVIHPRHRVGHSPEKLALCLRTVPETDECLCAEDTMAVKPADSSSMALCLCLTNSNDTTDYIHTHCVQTIPRHNVVVWRIDSPFILLHASRSSWYSTPSSIPQDT